VNWFEANAYCAWMTGKFGGKDWQFALPNDAEWEKASRGPDNLDYALSMTVSDAEVKLYNWKKNPEAPETVVGVRATMGRYIPNRYGLYHMTGNVAEWTQSVDRPFNREHPYAEDERNHDETPGQRTVRGGSWYSASIAYLSTPYRDAFLPSHSTQDIGFRVVARLLP
jgi:formylglycine-generating enzyme required for sulfatase activity